MSRDNVIPLTRSEAGRVLTERDDDELLRLARAGRTDAFELLVARHMHKLSGFCIKMLGDRRAGEDVAQETWLQVWARRADYRAQGRFQAFLYTIARNRCRNALRSSRRRNRVQVEATVEPPEAIDDRPSHLDSLLADERRRQVQDAMMELPSKLREAVLLRYAQQLDYPQIAAVVGRGESTVRSRVHHGLRRLRRLLGEEVP